MPHSFWGISYLIYYGRFIQLYPPCLFCGTYRTIDLGGDNPIRIQSMTTTNTNDTEACVRQAEEIIKRLVASWCASPLRVPARQRT